MESLFPVQGRFPDAGIPVLEECREIYGLVLVVLGGGRRHIASLSTIRSFWWIRSMDALCHLFVNHLPCDIHSPVLLVFRWDTASATADTIPHIFLGCSAPPRVSAPSPAGSRGRARDGREREYRPDSRQRRLPHVQQEGECRQQEEAGQGEQAEVGERGAWALWECRSCHGAVVFGACEILGLARNPAGCGRRLVFVVSYSYQLLFFRNE